MLNEIEMNNVLSVRSRARSDRMQALASQRDKDLVGLLAGHLLPLLPGETRLAAIERIVDAEYPSLTEPYDLAGLRVEPQLANDGEYDYVRNRDASAAQQRVHIAREVGGVSVQDLPLGERAFVGYRLEDGTVVKLNATDVLRLSGFDADSRTTNSVVIVSPAPTLIEAKLSDDYFKSKLVLLREAVWSGEPDEVHDVLNAISGEMGWGDDIARLHAEKEVGRQIHDLGQVQPKAGAVDEAPTEVIQLPDGSTPAEQVLAEAPTQVVTFPKEAPKSMLYDPSWFVRGSIQG